MDTITRFAEVQASKRVIISERITWLPLIVISVNSAVVKLFSEPYLLYVGQK